MHRRNKLHPTSQDEDAPSREPGPGASNPQLKERDGRHLFEPVLKVTRVDALPVLFIVVVGEVEAVFCFPLETFES